MNYPNITKACLEIAYDNGGVHRYRSEEKVRSEIDEWLEQNSQAWDLERFEYYLGTLSEEELHTACAGEEEDMVIVTGRCHGLLDFLTQYFQDVC